MKNIKIPMIWKGDSKSLNLLSKNRNEKSDMYRKRIDGKPFVRNPKDANKNGKIKSRWEFFL